MNEKLSEEEKKEALFFISIILPFVGLVMCMYYWIKKNKSLAWGCLLWALAGVAINVIIKLIFNGLGQQRPLIDLSTLGSFSPILFGAIFAYVFSDFIDLVKFRWWGLGALATSVIYGLLPALHIKHSEELVAVPLVLVFAFVYSMLKKTKLKNWLNILLSLVISIVWTFLLSMVTGLIYGL